MNEIVRQDALLLLGPTGSGKTPLGDLLEQRGLPGRSCRHFDFGHHLRRIAAGEAPPAALTTDDVAFVRRVLDEGALLEDEHFPIAEVILRDFLAATGDVDVIILNGLPRHVGQAKDVGRIVEVAEVINLTCPAEIVLQRIAANAGGDRAERTDDDLADVQAKLDIFTARIAPLVNTYRRRGATIREIPIAPTDTAEDVWRKLDGPA